LRAISNICVIGLLFR